MKAKFERTLEKIRRLEKELEQEFSKKSRQIIENFKKRKIRFEKSIHDQQKKFKTGLLKYIFGAKLRHILISPIIYFMIIPITLMDLTIFLYQHICFRVYKIPRVKRNEYFVIDRQHLSYLNLLEKFNCVYCGYGNAVAAYTKETIARTEQYWCPIKHASHVKDPHSRYYKFFEYGDAEKYRSNLKKVIRDYDD
ncbi:MAG: hypothetical protein ISS00_02330 [Candidatus Marinimicrobia bacterium]|nr:hypothetical protein [Candidatus Neomarinimicrobiota bacterium]